MVIYEPREDSFLLEKYVRKLAVGSVLDMCTGTGIQALAAAESSRVKKVLAVDINREAIDYAKKHSAHKKIKYVVSDLFSKVPKQKFDTIICNPPYLPQQAQIRDIATEGGKLGYEFIERFLAEAGSYLKSDGNILLVFSSLTDRSMVHSLLEQYLFSYRFVDSVHYFFEEIYVYNIVKSKTAKE
ncbi:MAG: methyltransferase, partial [Candidatus Woesearchaeota archaeon]